MTTLIFGSDGQFGHELLAQLQAQGQTAIGLNRAQCDVTQPDQIRQALSEYQPERVYNATAYNAVDGAETDPDGAMRLNGLVPGDMAAACHEMKAAFVHVSTDYVFGEGFSEPIDESQPAMPLSVYGRSKRLGEILALQNNPQTWVLRTCGLYSERRHNFIRTMIRLALSKKSLKIVSDQVVAPTWVRPLAEVAMAITGTKVRGIYHATSQGACSWFEYAQAIFEFLGLTPHLEPVQQTDWSAPAPRPSYSALDNQLLRFYGLDVFPHWRDGLEAFLGQYGKDIVEQERGKLAS